MKSNKELVYEYMSEITQREFVNEKRLFTTLELAESLKMQRTNISTYLNELVKENRVIKKPGKPVYYELSTSGHQTRKEDSCFQSCIGYDGSLKNAIQLAKAAILYPSHSLSTFLVGPGGSGKSYFAQLMCDFAKEKGVIKKDAPFVKFNCSYYEGAEEEIYESLFGKDREHEGAIYKAKGEKKR